MDYIKYSNLDLKKSQINYMYSMLSIKISLKYHQSLFHRSEAMLLKQRRITLLLELLSRLELSFFAYIETIVKLAKSTKIVSFTW